MKNISIRDYTTHVTFHFFRNFPLILRHFDRAAKTYEQNSSLQFATSLMAIDWLRQFFKKDNRSSWLELGCATGKLAALISDQSLANNVDAVDLSGEMIAFAKKNHFRKSISYSTADLQKKSFWQNCLKSYDCIVALALMHWLKNRDFVLSEIYDHLKPGGYFCCSYYLGQTYCELDQLLGENFRMDLPSYAEVLKELRGANFEIVKSIEHRDFISFPSFKDFLDYQKLQGTMLENDILTQKPQNPQEPQKSIGERLVKIRRAIRESNEKISVTAHYGLFLLKKS